MSDALMRRESKKRREKHTQINISALSLGSFVCVLKKLVDYF